MPFSGDILSAIERDLERRTQEARQVLQQRRDGILPPGPGVLHVKQEELLHHHHHQHPEVINVCPPTTILHGGGAASIHTSGGGPFTQIVHAAPAGGATLMHGGGGEVKPTKYVQYMQVNFLFVLFLFLTELLVFSCRLVQRKAVFC